MTIRIATSDDLERIRHVAERSWGTDYPDIVSRETIDEGIDEWYAFDQLADELDRSRTLLLVAVDQDTVVGFAHGGWENDNGYILRLYVDPAHRRSGIGSRLLERIRDELFDQGVDCINAMVLTENDLGNAFYREQDFEQTAQEETTIGEQTHSENTYILERE